MQQICERLKVRRFSAKVLRLPIPRAQTLRFDLVVSACENKRPNLPKMSSQQDEPRHRGRGRGYGTADTDPSRRRPRPESLNDSGKKYSITTTLPFHFRSPLRSTEQN